MFRDTVVLYGMLPFLNLCFALAAPQSLASHPRRRRRHRARAALAYLLQTAGLLLTGPMNSGLIVVFAPLADRLFFGARLSRPVLVAVFLSFVGMVLLARGGSNCGDALALLCAGALGLHIVLLSRYAAGYDVGGLAFVQLLSMVFVFGLFRPLSGPVTRPREV